MFLLGGLFSVSADQLMLFPLTSTYQNATSDAGIQSGTMTINASSPVYTGSYLYTTGWGNDGDYNSYETSVINTEGYYNIVVSASMYSFSTGVRDIQLQCKVGSGSWTAVSDFSLTTTATNYSATLPDECNNESEVYVRWIATSYTSVGGGTVSALARNFIYSVSITGDLPAEPNTQAHTLRFVAITPTTIRVSCTPGNGDHRIIVMNTSNSFTLPTDDYYPTANSTYAGGQQVIYNGTGSYITVNVASAFNDYYFRVFDFKYNGGMTRYVTETASDNPRACSLAEVDIDPVTNIRLTRATFNGEIDQSEIGIYDRGFVWSLTSGNEFDLSSNKFSEYGSTAGIFSLDFPSVDYGTNNIPRGSTVYVKAYVENISGTSYSYEYEFNNIPMFTGDGVWEDPTKWNVQEVPGENGDATYGSIDDSPIINGYCRLEATNTVTDLTVYDGALKVAPGALLTIDGTLTNSVGTSGLMVLANDTDPNGSLIYNNGSNIQATVEMYSKAYWNKANPAGSKYGWQYFGIPVTSIAYSPTFTSSYVRAWDESVNSYENIWYKSNDGSLLMLNSSSTLESGVAYELVQSVNREYSFKGTLVHSDYSKSLDYTTGAYYIGQNMLSNPYTASMDIRDIVFGSNTNAAVYLYNTGTFNEWFTSNGESSPGEGPGTYTVSTPGTAGSNGVPLEIASMQGYMVRATGTGGSVSFDYDNLLQQTAVLRSASADDDLKISTRIDLKGNNFTDRMWIFVDETCSDSFDNGFDGEKLLGYDEQSQIYGIGDDGIYQINAIYDINNAVIGFKSGLDTSFVLSFNHENIDRLYNKLYLIDEVEDVVVDITESGSEYSFTASQYDSSARFRVVSTLTNVDSDDISDSKSIYTIGNVLYINNEVDVDAEYSIYDISGKLVKSGVLDLASLRIK